MSLRADTHLHFRGEDTEIFKTVAPWFIARNDLIVSVLNLPEPITFERMESYWAALSDIRREVNPRCRILLMPALHNKMTPDSLQELFLQSKLAGIPIGGVKLFPQGQTTNAGDAPNIEQARALFPVLRDWGIPLNIHMEDPDAADITSKEASYVRNILPKLVRGYEDVKVVLEHISTKESVDYVKKHPDVMCTITPHHMLLSLERLGIEPNKPYTSSKEVEYKFRTYYPYLFCKPVPQREEDRAAVREFFLSGSQQIMTGSDSAPHPIDKKEDADAFKRPAGVFIGDVRGAYLQAILEGVSVRKNDRIKRAESLLGFYGQNALGFYLPEENPSRFLQFRKVRPVPTSDMPPPEILSSSILKDAGPACVRISKESANFRIYDRDGQGRFK